MLKKVAQKIGIDRAIFYTASARVFQGLGGIVSVLLVATCLSGVEQGFYYTFASISAMQIFFELGLGGIIVQFVAHEKAHLEESDNRLIGSPNHLSRLAYLLRFCIKWYAVLAVALFVLLTVVGLVFFSHFYKSDVPVQWQIPWILLVIGTSINFILVPISAYLEGLGKVKEIAFVRLLQQTSSQILIWSGLLLGMKLYVVFIAPFVMFTIFVIYAWRKFGCLLINIFKTTITEKISYRHEIFPFQWKIALSWISGYFIFQLFNPVLFATEGAVVAGQMGMTLAALNAILGLTLSWITTKVPVFSAYIAQKNYALLDKLFNRTLVQSSIINVLGLIGLFLGVFIIRYYDITIGGKNLGDRLLPYLPMFFMMVPILLNQIIAGWATYLRCHKQEPMMIQSITMGILCSLSTVFLGKYYGVVGLTLGYMALSVISFVWTYFIFTANKKRWHNE